MYLEQQLQKLTDAVTQLILVIESQRLPVAQLPIVEQVVTVPVFAAPAPVAPVVNVPSPPVFAAPAPVTPAAVMPPPPVFAAPAPVAPVVNVPSPPVFAAPAPVTPAAVMPPPPVFAAPAPVAPVVNVPFTDGKGLIDYVMKSYSEMGTEKGAGIGNVLNQLGYKNINDVKPEHYAALFAGIEGLK